MKFGDAGDAFVELLETFLDGGDLECVKKFEDQCKRVQGATGIGWCW